MTSSMTWSAAKNGRVYDADEGMVVYFDPNSGDTHLISDFAACVVDLLAGDKLNEQELTTRLHPMTEEISRDELAETIHRTLQELVDMAIVTRG